MLKNGDRTRVEPVLVGLDDLGARRGDELTEVDREPLDRRERRVRLLNQERIRTNASCGGSAALMIAAGRAVAQVQAEPDRVGVHAEADLGVVEREGVRVEVEVALTRSEPRGCLVRPVKLYW